MPPYVFLLLIDDCIEEIEVDTVTETEAWIKAREVQRNIYAGKGELRLWF
jgi:hypothetical protein